MKKLILLSLVGLIGCSTVFTHKREIEPGIYWVEATGNMFNTREDLAKKINQRALKLCGHDRYVLSDSQEFTTADNNAYVQGQFLKTSITALSMYVSCNNS